MCILCTIQIIFEKTMKKQIAILGSTGSIGKQALEVIEAFPDMFEVHTLTANNSAELLIEQARKFMPDLLSLQLL